VTGEGGTREGAALSCVLGNIDRHGIMMLEVGRFPATGGGIMSEPTPREPFKRFVVERCYEESTTHRDGTIDVVLDQEDDSLISLTVDDGQGNTVTVVLGWREVVRLMTALGAVGEHL
jgi:hypothetical protein